MVGPVSPREHQLAHARYALEKMADMIEEAAADTDEEIIHCKMVMGKAFGMLVRDTGGTALHPAGPWSGMSMVAMLMCDVDLTVHLGELPSLNDLIQAARRIPVGAPARGTAPEAKLFLEQLEGIQARVLGYGDRF